MSRTALSSMLLACLVSGRVLVAFESGFRPQKLMPPRLPITSLAIKSKAEGDNLVRPDELVVGITINNESRAYPLNMIKGPDREVLNDTLGTKNILVTWCSLCFTNLVFDRTLNGDTLEFALSGMLWNNNMVLYDSKTKSLWSQMLGRAMQGPLNGKELDTLPSVITSWTEWSNRYPNTTVVVFSRTATANIVKNYKESKLLVIGIPEGGGKAWPLSQLRKSGLVNDVWDGRGVLATYSEKSGAAKLFARDFGSIRLEFLITDGQLKDRETNSTWNALSGKCISGPLIGASLPSVNSVISFQKTWQLFFPSDLNDGA